MFLRYIVVTHCDTFFCYDSVGLGVNCEYYHAGISNKERKRVHHLFIRDEIQVSLQ